MKRYEKMTRKSHKFNYIYKITNTKNRNYYIGMHSTHNLDDGYMGGGKRITNSVRKHGKDAHTKEILEYFDDRESLRQKEIEIVNEDFYEIMRKLAKQKAVKVDDVVASPKAERCINRIAGVVILAAVVMVAIHVIVRFVR
mgnify:CR=1 FL=1